MLARMLRPMHTYLLGRKKNQSIRSSADARQIKPRRKSTANRWAYVKLHTNRQTWNPNANHWTYIRLRTNTPTLETKCQLLDLYRTPSTQQEDTECQSLGLHPSPNTHNTKGLKKEKGRPERSTHLLPTYLIWYEDQGDVVPLRREKRTSLTR